MSASLVQLQGVRTSRKPGFVARVIRVVTGYALVHWLTRTLGYIVGWRYRTHFELASHSLAIRQQLSWLGRTIHDRASIVPLGSVQDIEREIRYPLVHTLTGLMVAAVAVVLASVLASYGGRVQDWSLVGLGAGVALLGALLDLALDVWVPADRGTVTVYVRTRGRVLGVRNVRIQDADRFIMEFYRRVPSQSQ